MTRGKGPGFEDAGKFDPEGLFLQYSCDLLLSLANLKYETGRRTDYAGSCC